MEYLKLDPDIDSNPEIMRAGWWGARFFELLLKVSAKKDLKGRIPPDYQSYEWLARMWNLELTDLDEARDLEDSSIAYWMNRGLVGAIDAKLVTVDGEDWVLRGWDKFYKPAKTGAQRQAAYEQRQRVPAAISPAKSDAAPSASVRTDTTDEPDATSHHITPPTPLHTTHVDVRAGVPVLPEKPEKPDDAWDGMDFWAWTQAKRREAGFHSERKPNESKVSSWWSQAQMQGATPKSLRTAFIAFGNDPYWTSPVRSPPIPFGGFLSQWERFVIPEESHVAE